MLQALSMLPVMLALYRVAPAGAAGSSRTAAIVGVGGDVLLALSFVLLFAGVTSDGLYMAPQGLVGVWLILINRLVPKTGGRGFRWLGFVAGAGLILIGASFLSYAGLVAPAVLLGPMSPAQIDALPWNTANVITHIGLAAGTLFGPTLYPIWTLLLARKLFRTRSIA